MKKPEDPKEERDEPEEEPEAREEPVMTPFDAIREGESEPGAMPSSEELNDSGPIAQTDDQEQDKKSSHSDVVKDGPRDPGDRKWTRGPRFRRDL